MHGDAGLLPSELAARTQRFALLQALSLPVWVFDIDCSRVHWANTAALRM